MRGFFISIEGPEGAGKTTIINQLSSAMSNNGMNVISTREPGGIHISEQIRKVILDKNNTMMDPHTEALLYAAARSQHLTEKILPGLEKGAIILCDRFIDSSLAYQGYARGLGIDEIFTINQFAIQNTMPDLTIYFDIEPEIGLERIEKNQGREINRLDLEKVSFHHKVREGYHLLLKKFPSRIRMVDASKSIDEVYIKTKKIIDDALESKSIS